MSHFTQNDRLKWYLSWRPVLLYYSWYDWPWCHSISLLGCTITVKKPTTLFECARNESYAIPAQYVKYDKLNYDEIVQYKTITLVWKKQRCRVGISVVLKINLRIRGFVNAAVLPGDGQYLFGRSTTSFVQHYLNWLTLGLQPSAGSFQDRCPLEKFQNNASPVR